MCELNTTRAFLDHFTLTERLELEPGSPTAGKLRAYQISSLVVMTPFLVAANIVNATLLYLFLRSGVETMALPIWWVAQCIVSLVILALAVRARTASNPQRASQSAIDSARRYSTMIGILWGLGGAMFYIEAGQGAQMVVVALFAGVIGIGALALHVVPCALIRLLSAITAGGLAGLLMSANPIDLMIAPLLIAYGGLLLLATMQMADKYGRNVLYTLELADKSESIGHLLREFSVDTSDWLWQADADGNLTVGAEEFSRQFGQSVRCLAPQAGNAQTPKCLERVWAHFADRQPFSDLQVSFRAGNETVWLKMTGKPIFGELGRFKGFNGFASNFTREHIAEERIAYLAHNDALTGLVNRAMFSQRLEMLLADGSERFWAIAYLDLDGFKRVNDAHGHGIGDKLLTQVAQRMRKTFADNDVLARLGGDEFAVICLSAAGPHEISTLAENAIAAISQPYTIDGKNIRIGASIGVAVAGRDGTDAETLLNSADLALYRAKRDARGQFRFFEPSMDEVVKERREMEGELGQALARKELFLRYQPLVSAADGATTGFEALVRWNHPTRGEIAPGVFIPLAEAAGYIGDIGDWVLREACIEASSWEESLTVAINLSPLQFEHGDIVGSVRSALADTGLDPKRLELEITESLFINKTEHVLKTLQELRALGVSIALDDFGTGYSSLSYLLKFPFDKLKIDRSFIASIDEDPVARDVLEAIARLGTILNLNVTAEGVETSTQAEYLRGMSCTHFQGFLFSRPLSGADVASHLSHQLEERGARGVGRSAQVDSPTLENRGVEAA